MSYDPLQPWRATADDPFDLGKAGHLLRRAAFGGSLQERRAMVRTGVDRAVDSVVGEPSEEVVEPLLDEVLAMGSIERVRAWRVWRLMAGQRRLTERLSYFWHDHFATSNQKVDNARAMALQMSLFDRLGSESFDELLLAVSRDPAMIEWLDNDTNVEGKANENFARELFELFALGRGNYSERDVQEAARAFTGWHVRDGRFHFNRRYHDDGDKEVLGERGPWDGEDVVKMAVRHPASAEFLARKWLAFFVHPEPTDDEVDALVRCYVDQKRHVGKTLRVLLRSRLFFGERAFRSRVKSPADWVIGLVRSLGARAAPARLAQAIAEMGEVLLEPPSVAGWTGDRAWLNSATWLLRLNFAAELFAGRRYKLQPLPERLLRRIDRPDRRVRAAELYLLDGKVSEAGHERIVEFARGPAARGPGGTVALFQAVLTLPEAQLL